MGNPLRFKQFARSRRAVPVLLIATMASGAMLIAMLPPVGVAAAAADTSLYDAFYRLRTPQSRRSGPVMIVTVDQSSIDRMGSAENAFRWPWPRVYWGAMLEYFQNAGAKAVAVDLLFDEPSGHNQEADDDKDFAAKLDELKMPVILAALLSNPDAPARFAPPVKKPANRAAVDVIDSSVLRAYKPFVNDKPSLAAATVQALGHPLPAWAHEQFLLHHYGPTRLEDGTDTYRYLPAYEVIVAMLSPDGKAGVISPEVFKDKIIVIGVTAAGWFDLKHSPLSEIYPGVEAHATAIDNLLLNQRVIPIGRPIQIALGWAGSLIAAIGALAPRRVWVKILAALSGVVGVFILGYAMFTTSQTIRWLPITAPMLAAALAAMVGLGWSYFVEDRRRRTMLKFLSQYVSAQVAAQLARQDQLSLVGQRREMTVMFTDIAGFTNLADQMPVETLEALMSLYLSEMSGILFDHDATLDKYIGDAIMSFWSAPLEQPAHAEMACRAALRMRDREHELLPRYAELGAATLRTRIGINTGNMVVGNVGSEQKVNYTVLGDAVNLASRLEGANKLYGTQILVAEHTVERVRDKFLFRKLDLLRVKGRSQPLEVYELLADGPGDQGQRKLAGAYESAFAAYRGRDWDEAERTLVDLLKEFADDGASVALLGRVRALRDNPPASDWNGAYDMKEK